jgi:glutathione peroxidase
MSIYKIIVKDTHQNEVSLDQYRGKVLLIVNTATKCGYTTQYEGLEDLYEDYQDQGFEILDFPCNQFMNQAPGSDEELASFCQLKFNTKFQTFAKVDVNGKTASPLFKFLKQEKRKDLIEENKTSLLSSVTQSSAIKWNFTKFIVDRNGKVVYRFAPSYEPEKLRSFIERLL